jgi:hypothetical protein
MLWRHAADHYRPPSSLLGYLVRNAKLDSSGGV